MFDSENLQYIDIHSHLNLSPLKEKKEEVLRKMEEEKIGTIIVGVDLETSQEAVSLTETKDYLWATIGLHPTDNTKEIFNYEEYKKLALNQKVVAIGECGLDYFRLAENEVHIKENQKELFKKHIELALAVNKPLMIHARPSKDGMDAYSEVLDILEEYKKNYPELVGNFHFFVGNIEIAKRILALNFTISFDGPITFTNQYDDVIAFVPLDHVHAETDAPFAAPIPFRGKVCEPWMVTEIVKKVADIKKLSTEQVREQFLQNFKNLFIHDTHSV